MSRDGDAHAVIRSAMLAVLAPSVQAGLDLGLTEEEAARIVAAEAIELAAHAHVQAGGLNTSFLDLARDTLALVRTGAPDQ